MERSRYGRRTVYYKIVGRSTVSESVADGNSYKGVYFKLSNDIDLSDNEG